MEMGKLVLNKNSVRKRIGNLHVVPKYIDGVLEDLISDFIKVRKTTLDLFKPLELEDAVIQSDTFGSPPNWHLAHVSWFFQKVLEKHGRRLEPHPSSRTLVCDEIHKNITNGKRNKHKVNTQYLNSYYQQFGNILPKSERGKFPRPTVRQTLQYRLFIEKNVISFLKEIRRNEETRDSSTIDEIKYDIILGIQHEMQHQELMIYDLQHYFHRFRDPGDNYSPLTVSKENKRKNSRICRKGQAIMGQDREKAKMVQIPGGIFELGFNGKEAFCYDNELPEHKVYLEPYRLDVAPVTNGNYIKFIEDGGYHNFKYWLADGWDLVQEHGWEAPLYWEPISYNQRSEVVGEGSNFCSKWVKKDFRGLKEVNKNEPVVNVSYYEADAYARWAGKRLPTEAEWEKAASWNDDIGRKTFYPWGDESPTPKFANLLESNVWGPSIVGSLPEGASYYGCHNMIGDVWEWTSSEYVLYPGFKPKFSEYTDKWAINQKVLRGGCFATPTNQVRNSYRNYFKPHERMPFSGFRCAMNI